MVYIEKFKYFSTGVDQVFVRKLNTFTVSCGSGSVAENGAVIRTALFEFCSFTGSFFENMLERDKSDAKSFQRTLFFLVNSIECHNTLEMLSETIFLHLNQLLDKSVLHKHGCELSLIEDVIDGLDAHRVEETNGSVIEIHIANVGNKPLPSVSRPDADEFPFPAITLDFLCKVKSVHS